jgi:hypothetical protein
VKLPYLVYSVFTETWADCTAKPHLSEAIDVKKYLVVFLTRFLSNNTAAERASSVKKLPSPLGRRAGGERVESLSSDAPAY